MSNIDDQLRAALRRLDPPPGLVDRVLEQTTRRRRLTWTLPWAPVWSMSAIAATLVLVLFSVTTYQHTREERAARQAELALRIAAEKLNLARDRVFKNAGPKDY